MSIDINKFMQIIIGLTAEKDRNKFLSTTLKEAMSFTKAEAGVLYVYSEGLLYYKLIRNDALKIYQGEEEQGLAIPPILCKEDNICSQVASTGVLINIQRLDQSQKEKDISTSLASKAMGGYEIVSLLVVPLINNNNEIVGVLQLINAKDDQGNIIAFNKELETMVLSLGSLAAVALTNIRDIQEIEGLFHSFITVLTTTMDERTPFNANHTSNVALYTEKFIDYLNSAYARGETKLFFPPSHKEELIISAWLHDIGKLTTPVELLNKATRLNGRLNLICLRFQLIEVLNKLELLRKSQSHSEWEEKANKIETGLEMIKKANLALYVNEEQKKELEEISKNTYLDKSGNPRPWLTPEELNCLCVPKGTLTQEERKIVQDHVTVTKRLLDKIKLNKKYLNITQWAGGHHELLDGSGYPQGLRGDEISVEMRILAIIDIFEALTAPDRPYKKSLPPQKALTLLRCMAKRQKVDGEIVRLLAKSRIWEK